MKYRVRSESVTYVKDDRGYFIEIPQEAVCITKWANGDGYQWLEPDFLYPEGSPGNASLRGISEDMAFR